MRIIKKLISMFKKDNMKVYNQGKTVPEYAQSKILGGKLVGKTNISPMWRIEKLTEIYGTCGTGWYYEIISKYEKTAENGTIQVFVDINLYVKEKGLFRSKWSKPIHGTGGSTYLGLEKGSLIPSDECYKMAETDALSYACKNIGIGADIYMGCKNDNKYDKYTIPNTEQEYKSNKKEEYKKNEEQYKPRYNKLGYPLDLEQDQTKKDTTERIVYNNRNENEKNKSKQNFKAVSNHEDNTKPICNCCGATVSKKRGGVLYTTAQVYEYMTNNNSDGVPRCKACTLKNKTYTPYFIETYGLKV